MDPTTTPQITTTLDAGVLLLTLNRPDKLNAYTAQMGREITTAFQRAGVGGTIDAQGVIWLQHGFGATNTL